MDCPFCFCTPERIAFSDENVVAIWDAFPVAPGHMLIFLRSHVPGWPQLSEVQRSAVLEAIERAQTTIAERFEPDGFNVGFNQGAAAGQTIFHFHLHVIPRYHGDMSDPRGGVRHVIPGKGNYLAGDYRHEPEPSDPAEMQRLVTGDNDPFLPHLRSYLDRAARCDIAVSFLLDSGARLVFEHLRDFLVRGGRARILVGDYLDVTEPAALRRLGDLAGDVQLRIYQSGSQGFHLKSYIFGAGLDGIAFVGSSNLSGPALTNSIEWNYKVVSGAERQGFEEITRAFEALFASYAAVPVTEDWVRHYEQRRIEPGWVAAGLAEEAPPPPAIPHRIQIDAMVALAETRAVGFTAGLIVLATGLGKTWLSAFDSDRAGINRILFIAHREEILDQAIATFRRVKPDAAIGRLAGTQRDFGADMLFASIQTLARPEHISRFEPNHFDYIVVDEFHHAAATSYRRVIDYFQPKFLLGLTATPERMDGADLLGLCQENLVYEAGVTDGIRAGLLCPFQYYGVSDAVNYAQIPWRNARFDADELTAAVATEARAQNALDQFRRYGGERCIAFCCSQRHADFMAGYFRAQGMRAVAVHTGPAAAPRATSLERLKDGELDVIFAVDIFNEGVDLPAIDTVLMLRPTESAVIWLQQFGRGLRISPGKSCLKVIDYIGNHRSFLVKLRSVAALAGVGGTGTGTGTAELRAVLDDYRRGTLDLPEGCAVTYDLEVVDIFSLLTRAPRSDGALEAFYLDFVERHGIRPTAIEAFHAGFVPRSNTERSWLGFVIRMGGLTPELAAAFEQSRTFLDEIEKTRTTRSYKIVLLLAMLAAEALPGTIDIDTLTSQVARLAARIAKVRADFSVDLMDTGRLRRLLLDNPVMALTAPLERAATAFFHLEGDQFSTRFTVPDVASFRELLREVLDWRLAEYLARRGDADATRDVVCRVARAGEPPVLFLPNGTDAPTLELGPLPVIIDGEAYEATVGKIEIKAVCRPGSNENLLPAILHRWFGADAGLPGRGERVQIRRSETPFLLEPLPGSAQVKGGLTPGGRYLREAIAPAFRLHFSQAIWNAGFVYQDPEIFLLVTLVKRDMAPNHAYADHFLSDHEFAWQSQNRTTRDSKHGQLLRNHAALGKRVHLLVRPTKKTGSKPTPFVYCGEVDFVSWEGEAPITIIWRLREPVPEPLQGYLRLPD